VELILGDCGLERRQLSDLMAQGRRVAAPELAPTAGAVGRLADMQFIDLYDGPEPPSGPRVS
jgi:hypothetical protein